MIYLPSVDKPGLEVNFATSTILTANCWLVVLWIHLRTMLNGPLKHNHNISLYFNLAKALHTVVRFRWNDYNHKTVIVCGPRWRIYPLQGPYCDWNGLVCILQICDKTLEGVLVSARSKGVPGTCAPSEFNFFHFHAFFWENLAK